MADKHDEVFRVTLGRANPQWYQARVSVKIKSRRQLLAQLKSCSEYGNGPQVLKIERAPIEGWTDVTAEMLGAS